MCKYLFLIFVFSLMVKTSPFYQPCWICSFSNEIKALAIYLNQHGCFCSCKTESICLLTCLSKNHKICPKSISVPVCKHSFKKERLLRFHRRKSQTQWAWFLVFLSVVHLGAGKGWVNDYFWKTAIDDPQLNQFLLTVVSILWEQP